ncbi:NADH-dependent [FeFe] hydrogenase, group A6 [Candidatus Izemoplasma sp. B36]|uniref:NADH-dependent [FeFe] hydrogenase, group A6 n=1 Tax=Candidatus Izemoplasma sp. B36 TaxID=3242468 RepID=UPI003557EE1B
MANLVNLTIDGKKISVPSDYTIMKAADSIGISIPRLCFLEGIHEESNCRVCVVKVEGQNGLKTSCSTKVTEGMIVNTDTKEVFEAVSFNLELLAGNHKFECWKCSRENSCEFLDLLRRFNVDNDFSDNKKFDIKEIVRNETSDAMVLDSSKCVLCGRCVSACEKLSGLGILNFSNRGSKTYIGPAQFHNLEDAGCIYCGKCIQACPTGAIREKDEIKVLERALRDKSKTIVVQVAPSIRAALGEEFGYKIGTNVEGQMFAALKELGIHEIMDTNFTADLTILEEGTEFISRVQNGGVLPMFTSCSPGWINYLELYYPDYISNLSSCKSPQQMAGALIKTYYAKKLNKKPEDIFSLSIMPCVAKKAEANRPEMGRDGYRDVDLVLTTRELARIIRHRGIPFRELDPIKPYGDLAQYTGAATIFGATGGVMEAALRTVTEILEGHSTPVEFNEIRGLDNIKEATYRVAGIDVNVAVVHGGAAIKEFMNRLKTTDKQYHFVEFMGCTGGCINGGGQPIVSAINQEKYDVRKLRSKVLYNIDQNTEFRKSHENPAVKAIYKDFLEKPNSHKAHELLHTHYNKRSFYDVKF